jgi:hypothetical protein
MSYSLGSRKHTRFVPVAGSSLAGGLRLFLKTDYILGVPLPFLFHSALWVTCVSGLLGLHLVNVCLYVLRPTAVIDSMIRRGRSVELWLST